jgi:hypothetical protein
MARIDPRRRTRQRPCRSERRSASIRAKSSAARASGVIAVSGPTPDSGLKASASCGSIDGRPLRDLPRRRGRCRVAAASPRTGWPTRARLPTFGLFRLPNGITEQSRRRVALLVDAPTLQSPCPSARVVSTLGSRPNHAWQLSTQSRRTARLTPGPLCANSGHWAARRTERKTPRGLSPWRRELCTAQGRLPT